MRDTVLPLHKAAEQGRIEAVQFWVDHANDVVSSEFDLALRLAAEHGHTECVRLLIPVSNPKANKSSSLWMAAEMGHLEIVKLLIPCSDPLALNSYALQVAVLEKRADCVEVLYPHSDPVAAVAEMRTLYNPVLWQPFAQRVEHEQAAQQAERIGKSLENTPNAAHSKPTLPRKL